MKRRLDSKKLGLWEQRLKRFRESGLSIARFCAYEAVSVSSFSYWSKRLADQTFKEQVTPLAIRVTESVTKRPSVNDRRQVDSTGPQAMFSVLIHESIRKYSTSVAAAIIEAKWFHYLPIYRQQDLFASSGWTPGRSTLLNIVTQVAFVVKPFHDYMKGLVQQDIGVGIDETSCRMLLPKEPPLAIAGDLKNQRLLEKIAESKKKGEDSLLAKMWVYSGLYRARYNIFDFRVSRHRDGPEEFFQSSRCKVQGDCFSGNKSVVLKSDGRLEFVACWGHARRKVIEATTYKQEGELLLDLIRALYDIETRVADWSWQDRQALRQNESTIVLSSIKKWLDSEPLGTILPKSDFAEALNYIRHHWDALCIYTTDGRLPIDNNRVEQLMKNIAPNYAA